MGDLDAHLANCSFNAIYCVGGMTFVDGCEAQPDVAARVNANGPSLLAEFAAQRGIPFVYFSTEYVFSGRADNPGPYTETSRPDPLNAYGRSKLLGEQRIQEVNPAALILRTTVVYGPDAQAKNFVYAVLRALGQGKRLEVPEDQISTPTYNRDLAAATLALVEKGASGILHVAGPDRLGRLEFAQAIARLLQLDESLLTGVPTRALHQPAPRPLAAGLDTAQLRSTHPDIVMRSLPSAIAHCEQHLRTFS